MADDLRAILSGWLKEQIASYQGLLELLEAGREFPYAPPVGTPEERASGKVWPGEWVDANPIFRYYQLKPGVMAYHTGSDLNLNRPAFDSDAHAPVYSIGDGVVQWVRRFSGWDWVIVTKHEHCLARYAHCENIIVTEGQVVSKGQQLANVGNAGGNYPYHLHFDIARLTARMATVPGDWPGLERDRIVRDYYDPLAFLRGEIPLD